MTERDAGIVVADHIGYTTAWSAARRNTLPDSTGSAARLAALFRAAGWNVIRMAEFAWDILEPAEGVFDFTLFDETIARMGAAGIRTIP